MKLAAPQVLRHNFQISKRGGFTIRGPGRGLAVAAHKEVAAHELALGARLAPAAGDAVYAVVTHWLIRRRRIR